MKRPRNSSNNNNALGDSSSGSNNMNNTELLSSVSDHHIVYPGNYATPKTKSTYQRLSPRRMPTPRRSEMLGMNSWQRSNNNDNNDNDNNNNNSFSNNSSSPSRKAPLATKSFDESILSVESSSCSSSSSIDSKRRDLRRNSSAEHHDSSSSFLLLSSNSNRRSSAVRKRTSPKSGDNDNEEYVFIESTTSSTTSPIEKPIAASLSFRRKKRAKKKREQCKRQKYINIFFLIKSKKTSHRIFAIMFMLFVISFSMAFLSSRQITFDTIVQQLPDLSNLSNNNSNNNNNNEQQQQIINTRRRSQQVIIQQEQEGKVGNNNNNIKTNNNDNELSKDLTNNQTDVAASKQIMIIRPKPIANRPGRLRGSYKNKTTPPNNNKSTSEMVIKQQETTNNDEGNKIKNEEIKTLSDDEKERRSIRRRGNRPPEDTSTTDVGGDALSKQQQQQPPLLRRVESFQLYSEHAPSCSETLSDSDVTFTLVSQLSLNRLWMLEHHCNRWKHPISVAVFIGNNNTITLDSIQQEVFAMGCSEDITSVQILSGYSDEEYPVNVLRNLALQAVRTTHVVYVDIDFWPSMDLYDTLSLHKHVLASENTKQALVIPAFQLNRQCREWRECPEKNIPLMPKDYDDLVDRMIDHHASAFDPTNPGGHGSTRYKDWLEQEPDELLPIQCVNSNRYEPYLVFRYCHDLPPFQEQFTGYGKNKMTWIMQLRRSGYQLYQIGKSFVVHYPHLDSKARMHWNGGEHGEQIRKPKHLKNAINDYKRAQIDKTFIDFRKWLTKNIPDQTIIPKCNNAMDDDTKLWVEQE